MAKKMTITMKLNINISHKIHNNSKWLCRTQTKKTYKCTI